MSTDYTHLTKVSFDQLFARKGPGQEVEVMDSEGNFSVAGITATGPIKIPIGSLSAPSLAFATDTNTGLTLVNTDFFTVVTAGKRTASFSSDSTNNWLQFDISTGEKGILFNRVNDGQIAVSGGNSSGAGRNLEMYGGTHGSLANYFRLRRITSTDFEIDGQGKVTIGQPGDNEVHKVNGYLQLGVGSATANQIYCDTSNSAMYIGSDTGSSLGAQLRVHGSNHATLANVTQFTKGATVQGSISSDGLWTLGASGGSAVHAVNGVIAATHFLRSAAGTAAAVGHGFTGSVGTGLHMPSTGTTAIASAGTDVAYFLNSGGPNLQFRPSSAGTTFIYQSQNDGLINLSGGSGSSSGLNMRLYGGAHATLASQLEVRQGSTVAFKVGASTAITLGSGTPTHLLNTATQTTVGSAGGASALPATPTGYILINVNGTNRAIPYYAAS